jgi:hypothetical protein
MTCRQLFLLIVSYTVVVYSTSKKIISIHETHPNIREDINKIYVNITIIAF